MDFIMQDLFTFRNSSYESEKWHDMAKYGESDTAVWSALFVWLLKWFWKHLKAMSYCLVHGLEVNPSKPYEKKKKV